MTWTKCNILMPSQGSQKKASEHFRVCTAVQPITTAVATPLKYVCPTCHVRWPSVTAARSHYYQMHNGAPTLSDIDFGAGTPTPKRQCRKRKDFHFTLTYIGTAGPYLCPVSGCERTSNGYSQYKNLKAA